MAVYHLNTPLTDEIVRGLKVGDQVYLTGPIIGIRDATQIRIFDQGVRPPWDLRGQVLLHTAPSVRKVGDRYEPVVVGTTTSTRMERFTPGLLRDYGVKGVVGKGGLLQGSTRAMREYGGCYFAIVGGAAALETIQIEEIEDVAWEDLMPECLWRFRFRNLGPLVVAIDSHGNNLYLQNKEAVQARMEELYRRAGITGGLAV